MKRILLTSPVHLLAGLLFVTAAFFPLHAQTQPPVKVLTIGNSFANNATHFLPELAEAAGRQIRIGRANLGGASLQRHADAVRAYKADPGDPAGKPYRHPSIYPAPPREAEARLPRHSLREILEMELWDYVTLQQQSWDARDWNTYEPAAGELIAYVRRHAPQAEILIHQTWAYRPDHPDFKDGRWNQETMFFGISAAYAQLAEKYRLRLIPVGSAFQLARAWRPFTFPDPNFNYVDPQPGTQPNQDGSLVVGWSVRTDDQGRTRASLDAKHANIAGQYLGACVFFRVLLGERASDNSFAPPGLAAEHAAKLREFADEACDAQHPNDAARK